MNDELLEQFLLAKEQIDRVKGRTRDDGDEAEALEQE